MKNQYDNPFYKIFYGCLIIDETSLENLVNNSIQEILIEAGEKHQQRLPYPVLQPVLLGVHVVPSSGPGHQLILGQGEERH